MSGGHVTNWGRESDKYLTINNLLKRLEELANLPGQDRQGILFALGGLLSDAKANGLSIKKPHRSEASIIYDSLPRSHHIY